MSGISFEIRHCAVASMMLVAITSGCASSAVPVSKPPKIETPVTFPAVILVTGPDELSVVFESRWPLSQIRKATTLDRETDSGTQNLTRGPADAIWEGVLHANVAHEYDQLSWYAVIWNGRLYYSINAVRDGRHWILELGDDKDIQLIPLWFNTKKADRGS